MVKIAEVVEQNPWWNQGKEFAEYDVDLSKAKPEFFKRKELDFSRGNIYVIRGPRQVGKTTYIKDAIKRLIEGGVAPKDILYLSLDFFTSRRELRNTVNYFLGLTREVSKIYLFLDEITSLEDWNLELKYLADQGLTQRSVIVATGSSAVKLKQKGELLPGRGLEGNEYYLKPLSFREFALQLTDFIHQYSPSGEFRRSLSGLKTALPECSIDLDLSLDEIRNRAVTIMPYMRELQYLFGIYLATGGMPGVCNHYLINRYQNKKENIESSLSEIFIRDTLGDLSRIGKQDMVAREILKAVVERYGSRYSFSKLSAGIERTHITTIDYLETLGDAFITSILYAYDFNKKDVKFKGDKKVYFLDPFVFHSVKSYLTGKDVWSIITQALQDEELQADLVEGIVVSHLLMYRETPYLKARETFLWMYYDRSGKEIDAIVRKDKRYFGVEVKYQSQVDVRDVRQIQPVRDYLLLSREDAGGTENVPIVPVSVFLSLLPVSARNM